MHPSPLSPTPLSRRGLVVGAAWTTPAVLLAGAAPAFASSGAELVITSPASVAPSHGAYVSVPFTVTNIGAAATTGAVQVNVPGPTQGFASLTVSSLPPGWVDGYNPSWGPNHPVSTTLPIQPGASATFYANYTPGGSTPWANVSATLTSTNNAVTTRLARTAVTSCDLRVYVEISAYTGRRGQTITPVFRVVNEGSAPTVGQITLKLESPAAFRYQSTTSDWQPTAVYDATENRYVYHLKSPQNLVLQAGSANSAAVPVRYYLDQVTTVHSEIAARVEAANAAELNTSNNRGNWSFQITA